MELLEIQGAVQAVNGRCDMVASAKICRAIVSARSSLPLSQSVVSFPTSGEAVLSVSVASSGKSPMPSMR